MHPGFIHSQFTRFRDELNKALELEATAQSKELSNDKWRQLKEAISEADNTNGQYLSAMEKDKVEKRLNARKAMAEFIKKWTETYYPIVAPLMTNNPAQVG